MPHGQVEVAGGLNQSAKTMIVLFLGVGGGGHAMIVMTLPS